MPAETESLQDIVIYLDPLSFNSDGWSSHGVRVCSVPVAAGVNAAICKLVKYLGSSLFGEKDSERPRRIIIGDVGTVAAFADHALWAEGIGAIASLVAESGWGIPVIAYDSNSLNATGTEGLAALLWRADLVIETNYSEIGDAYGKATSRTDGTFDRLHWSRDKIAGPWPKEIERFANFPGPFHRMLF